VAEKKHLLFTVRFSKNGAVSLLSLYIFNYEQQTNYTTG
jgi:hypothetical protein